MTENMIQKMKNLFSAKTGTLIKNIFCLYGITAAKLILPLVTLPYLTRVLTTDCYGVAVYVKSCMVYVQLMLDFGFGLSATKEIVETVKKDGTHDNRLVGRITGDTLAAKGLLAVASAIFILILTYCIPILKANRLFTWLYFLGITESIFLLDFMFRGIEKMEAITVNFISAKLTSTILTFFVVKSDADLLLIPILEIAGNTVAAMICMRKVKKLGIRLSFSHPREWLKKIKVSFIYFASNIATTAFGALNTLFVGIYLPASDIACWSVSLQLMSAVQQMYAPIFDSLYPYMLKEKSKRIIRNILLVFMPIIVLGCIFCFVCAKWIILLVSGPQYEAAIPVFRSLIPMMFVSFPTMLFGWPVLGAMGKTKETTLSTVITAIAQFAGLIVLAATGRFTLVAIAALRIATETLMLAMRGGFCYRNRHLLH